ncbi:MAG: methylenetetrahydrofolate dehydrogenase (NADP+) / methenyltetrahydrofolate cyclohydrolase [Parcubacteria bacterium C7867-006]|nr:MAG: methylenetetrahydrofolate dehydrogenase (NADP+) / methenyltetrahydrofolate cyclohydrolase [Parcubacteria bacterium C7867-006]
MIADGKLVSDKLKKDIAHNLKNKPKKEVCFIIFGNDLASKQFIKMKCRFAESLGIPTRVFKDRENLSFEEVSSIVSSIVEQDIAGVVIQLPLPSSFPVQDVLNLVPVELDIDILSEKAKNEYKNGRLNKTPPVAKAVSEILDFYNVDLNNKNILVIGNGRLVGEPVQNMLTLKGIYFNTIDKNTDSNLSKSLIMSADVIISGAGSPHMIKPDMIKNGVVLIDAGTSEQAGKIVGDIDPGCFEKASLVTPVPGGVGPVTLASLFLNI